MKRQDLMKEIRGLSAQDLKQRSRNIAEEMMKLRFRVTTGQLEQTHRVRALRREQARIQTLLKQSEVSSKG